MFKRASTRVSLAFLWAILVAVSLAVRPLFPIDETRYASVAWEMWVRHDFLVPYLNGEAYSHKPPLLFWLMQLSWLLFGVNDWSLRIIAPLFSLATLYLSQVVAKQLWPGRSQIAELTPFILLGFFFWMVYSTLTMFDIMLSFFALLGIYSLLKLAQYGLSFKRWALLGLAIGGGVLTKGPVILLHVLPVALLAPLWLIRQETPRRWQHWYGGLVFAVLTGALIALCWAIPAGMAGGEAYRNAIFFGQTSGRVVDSFAHKLPFWWYLQLLPLVLFPWLLMKPFWMGLAKLDMQDFGIRFCLAWVLPVFIAFSIVSGKRIHYLLPLMPALALLLAWALDQVKEFNWRYTSLGYMAILGFLGLVLLLLPLLNSSFHWQEDLSSISPVWGITVLICATVFGVLAKNNTKDSVISACIASIATALVISCGFFQIKGERYDTAPPAQKIAELMAENKAVAYYSGKYHGQFNFSGRLIKSITVTANLNELTSFVNQHPAGYVLIEYMDSTGFLGSILAYHYPFKSHNIGFISCQTLLGNPRFGTALKPL